MRNKLIYFDNAATSFPKPEPVISEVVNCLRSYSGNPGRSGHKISIKASEAVYSTREKIADFVGMKNCDGVVLTSGATFAVNLAMRSGLRDGSHFLISDMEHNSVLRCAESLRRERGIEYDVFDARNLEASFSEKIRKNTTHIVSTLASNVTGEEIDLYKLSALGVKYNLSLILDASQALGHKKISLEGVKFDTLCSAGHKALFGMPGVGFAVFQRDILGEGIISGGSGTNSKSLDMPSNLPERFEAGTLPLPAIVSLGAGIDFINSIGINEVEKRLDFLTELLKSELSQNEKVEFCEGKHGIVSFNAKDIGSEELSRKFDDFGVCVRGGFHCAPLMHKKLGTYDSGALRVSFSVFNTEEEVFLFLNILEHILKAK